MRERMIYDCEVEGCFEKTDGYLCKKHAREAEEGNVVTCGFCGRIKRIEPSMDGKQKIIYEKNCLRCKSRYHIERGDRH